MAEEQAMGTLDANDLRLMVLAHAAGMAHEVVAAVRGSSLVSGYQDEQIEVAGVTWEITCFYWEESDLLRVNGAPKFDVEHPPHPFALIFQMAGVGEDNGSFSFVVPRAWLPPVVAVTEDEPEPEGR